MTSKEQQAAQALSLLKNPAFQICLHENKPAISLQIPEIEQMLLDAAPTEGKNMNQYAKRIFEVFNDLECLAISFRQPLNLRDFKINETSHCIDIPGLNYFFTKGMPACKILKQELLDCSRNALKRYAKNPELCAKIFNSKSIVNLRALLIYLHLPELIEYENMAMLNEIIGVILDLPAEAKKVLIIWLSSLPQETFINLISQLQQIISVFVADENGRFEEALQTDLLSRIYGLTIKEVDYRPLIYVVRFLELLHEGNQLTHKVQDSLFKNSAISNDITVIFNYRNWKKNDGSFTFCHYPWLLEVEFKSKILEEESKKEQELEKKRGIGMLSQMGPDNPLGFLLAGDLLYFNLAVRREHIIEDTLNILNAQTQNASFKKKLKVKFIGEPGVDEGGVRKEFFLILIKQLFDPQYGMFVEKMVAF